MTSSSEDATGVIFCRICHCGENDGPLFSNICKCTGSLANVHIGCLESWLQAQNSPICEICHTPIPVKEKCDKTCLDWLRAPENRKAKWALTRDSFMFCLIIVFLVLYSWLVDWHVPSLIVISIFFLPVIAMGAGSFYFYHYIAYKRWQEIHAVKKVDLKQILRNPERRSEIEINEPECATLKKTTAAFKTLVSDGGQKKPTQQSLTDVQREGKNMDSTSNMSTSEPTDIMAQIHQAHQRLANRANLQETDVIFCHVVTNERGIPNALRDPRIILQETTV